MSPPEVAPGVVEQPQIDGGPTAHAELAADEVKRLALRGVGALVMRSAGQRAIMMVGNVLLARWLAPKVFGVYAIVTFIVGMAGFLADLGMGAALVQRKEELTEDDLRTAFTLSGVVNLIVAGVLWLLAPVIVGLYPNLDPDAVTAVRFMSISVVIASFSVIPSIQLERVLRFRHLSLADIVSQAVYVGVAVSWAFSSRTVWCFVAGTLASRLVYAVIVNVANPWRPRLAFRSESVRGMLRFGLPYQMTGLVNAFKENPIPTFIAAVAGAEAVGYVTWGLGLATNALFLIPIVGRVTFPAYARLQHDPKALEESIEKSIKWVAATVFPATLLMAALARQIVEHVYGPKWAAGLPSFYWFCIPMLNAAYSTVMVSALYGLGRAKVVLRLTAIWAAAGWAIGVPFVFAFGYNGYAAAMSVVSCLSFLSVREMNKVVRIRFVPQLLRLLACAAAPAAVIAGVARFVVHDVWSLAVLGLAGGVAYVSLLYAIGELDDVVAMVRKRRALAPVEEPAGA